MAMPIPIVLLIMGVLLVEDVIGVFICHPILFRIDIRKVLFQE
jgi:hypothetical protein